MNGTETTTGDRLLCSQIIFRHGTRTPLHVLPVNQQAGDPFEQASKKFGFKSEFYGSAIFHPFPPSELVKVRLQKSKGELTNSQLDYFNSIGVDPDVKLKGGADFGMLTTQGRKQLFALGQKMADVLSAHPEFMACLPLQTNLRVQSSFIPRTIDSVQSFLSGLFSKCGAHINGFTDVIEVPVHVESFEEDFIFPNFLATPILNRNVQKLYGRLDDDHPLKVIRGKFLKEYDVDDYRYGILELDDELTCRKWLGLPMNAELAEWHEKFLDKTPEEFNYIYGYNLSHEDFVRITVGRLLNVFVKNMKSYATYDGPPFLYVFSSHDSTLHCLNIALGREGTEWPRFASYLLLQLFKGPKGLYLKITYNDQVLSINGNSEPSLDAFVEMVKPFLCTNEDLPCINSRLASEAE